MSGRTPNQSIDTPALRGAIMGTGMWSFFQISGWKTIPGVELVAVYNRTREKAENTARRFGIPRVYEDPERLLDEEKPDFVDIITEVPAHAPLVALAARHRIPVICQKPMGPDYQTCLEMVETCHQAGVPFYIHENFRHISQYRAFKKVLDEGHVGVPRRVQLFLQSGSREVYRRQPFSENLPHSILTDMGCHLFDLCRFFFGEPLSVYCSAMRRWADMIGESICAATLRYPNMLCSCAMSERINTQIFVDGDGGSAELKLDNSIEIQTPAGRQTRPAPEQKKLPWQTPELDNLYGACYSQGLADCLLDLYEGLRGRRIPETFAEDNLKTMRLVYAAVESTERNTAVRIG